MTAVAPKTFVQKSLGCTYLLHGHDPLHVPFCKQKLYPKSITMQRSVTFFFAYLFCDNPGDFTLGNLCWTLTLTSLQNGGPWRWLRQQLPFTLTGSAKKEEKGSEDPNSVSTIYSKWVTGSQHMPPYDADSVWAWAKWYSSQAGNLSSTTSLALRFQLPSVASNHHCGKYWNSWLRLGSKISCLGH